MLLARSLLLVILAAAQRGSGASAGTPSQWPYEQWCQRRLINVNNYTGCTAERREDLPALNETATFDVYYVSHSLSAGGSVGAMLDLTHSMVMIRERDNPRGVKMLLEYAAIFFGPKSMMPTIEDNGTLDWADQSVIAWQPEANLTKWLSEANATLLGDANGTVLNKYFDWAVEWRKNHEGYQLWSIWNQVNVVGAHRYFNDSVCHTFTEDSIVEMFTLGAHFYQQKPVCRNYFPFVGPGTPTLVDIKNSTQQEDVDKYYLALNYLLQRNYSNFTEFTYLLREMVELKGGIYIYKKDNEPRYWYSKLSPPFVSTHVYQRLVLPWQDHSQAKIDECGSDDPPEKLLGEFGHSFESIVV